MEHLMIDLETTGTKSGCAILSLAAVPFDLDTGSTGSPFTVEIDHSTSIAKGLIDEPETLLWWDNQDPEVKDFSWRGKRDIEEALASFLRFFSSLQFKDIYVWGNSPTFDLDILKYALKVCGLLNPFNPFLERDFRTHIAFAPNVKYEMPFEGKKHIPLHDAMHQVKVASFIWQLCNKIQFTWKV